MQNQKGFALIPLIVAAIVIIGGSFYAWNKMAAPPNNEEYLSISDQASSSNTAKRPVTVATTTVVSSPPVTIPQSEAAIQVKKEVPVDNRQIQAVATQFASDKTIEEPITITVPRTARLATPFEIAVTKRETELEEVNVSQEDEKKNRSNSIQEALVKISRTVGDTAYVTVYPMLLGSVTFTVAGSFKDGSFFSEDILIPVGMPTKEPKVFRGDEYPELSLSLYQGGDVVSLRPEAYYATIPDQIDQWGNSHRVTVYLDGRVDYRVVPNGASPVIELLKDKDGLVWGVVKALREGKAKIEARFGKSVDYIPVTVSKNL